MLGEETGIVRVLLREIAVWPASAILQCLREVPVVDRAPGANPGFEQRVDQSAVVVDALHVRHANARRLDARPAEEPARHDDIPATNALHGTAVNAPLDGRGAGPVPGRPL